MNKRVYKVLEFDKILKMLAGKAVSDSAKILAEKLVPKKELEGASRLMKETVEAESITLRFSNSPITSFSDCSSEIKRLKTQGNLNCKELLRLTGVFKSARTAKANIKRDDEGHVVILPEMAEQLFFDEKFIRKIDSAIIDEDRLADGASDELFKLKRNLGRQNDKLRDKLAGLTKSAGISKYLQDSIVTSRNGRYVVPVKAEHKKDVKGLVHDQSASGQTLFIEPEVVVEANNRIKQLEAEVFAEEQKILAELSSYAAEYTHDFANNMEILAYLDLVFAKAGLASTMKASPPSFNNDGIIHIKEGRHPLVDVKEVVPVTIRIGGEYTALIITGPNTGGKTVSIKTCGLFQLMAQAGLFLPAAGSSTLPVFKSIYADIGDEQSIEQSLSTFSSHMTNIVPILKNAGKGSLVLLDELGAGTDPAEGAALAMSILESIKNSGGYVMATTHYSEIKAFAMAEPGYENASMEFDLKTLSPTYNLRMGIPGLSNAFEISKKLGIEERIIERAKSHMSEERARFEELLNEAAASKKEAEKKIEQAENYKRTSQSIKDKAIIQQEKADLREKEIIRKAKENAAEIIKNAKEEAEEVISGLKKVKLDSEKERTQTIQKARSTLDKSGIELNKGLKDLSKNTSLKNQLIRVGDQVKLIGVGTMGTVLKEPDEKGMLYIQAGVMKLNMHMSEIENVLAPKKEVNTVTSKVFKSESQGKLEVDIRGMNVDEGLMEIDKYLDDVFLSGLKEVSIIHGKGTGKLRAGVHEYLKRHTHVKSYRTGQFGEGEMGVTIVTMK
jgi:DNA mismatch repair protein MutS2